MFAKKVVSVFCFLLTDGRWEMKSLLCVWHVVDKTGILLCPAGVLQTWDFQDTYCIIWGSYTVCVCTPLRRLTVIDWLPLRLVVLVSEHSCSALLRKRKRLCVFTSRTQRSFCGVCGDWLSLSVWVCSIHRCRLLSIVWPACSFCISFSLCLSLCEALRQCSVYCGYIIWNIVTSHTRLSSYVTAAEWAVI